MKTKLKELLRKGLQVVKSFSLKNWISIGLFVLSMVNQILVALGKSPLPITNEDVNILISSLFSLIVTIHVGYTNFNISAPAQSAQILINAVKEGKATVEEIQTIAKEFSDK